MMACEFNGCTMDAMKSLVSWLRTRCLDSIGVVMIAVYHTHAVRHLRSGSAKPKVTNIPAK